MAIKQNNFYQRWSEAEKADKTAARADLSRKLLLPGIVVAVCLIVWAVMAGYTAMLNARTSALLGWCSDPTNAEPYDTSLTNQTLAGLYRNESTVAQNVWDLLETYPDVTSSTLSTVRAAGGSNVSVVFQSYSAATGEFTFDAQSADAIDIPSYIRSLQATGLFNSVNYTGYGYNSAGTYTINVVCTLAAPQEGGQG